MQSSPSNHSHCPVWQLAGANSIGKSHLDSGLPNQDSFFYHQTPEFSVAVVCDGAGSASLSEQGSRYFAKAVGDFLRQNALQMANDPSQHSQIINLIKQKLTTIRQKLANQTSDEFSLKDYHSTVTAVLMLPNLNQALLLQIGDSPLLTSRFKRTGRWLDYFTNLQVFGDEDKTEYINETHFITQENWQDFLRIAWLDTQAVDCIALMTDGCADLVLAGGKQPRQVYRPFFANVLFNLLQTDSQEVANSLIQTALDNPATYRLTGDDKTLVVLVKNPQTWQTLEPLVEMPITSGNSLSDDVRASKILQSVWSSNATNNAQHVVQNSLSATNIEPTFKTTESTPVAQAEVSLDLIEKPKVKKPAEKLPEPIAPDNSQQTKKLVLAGGGMLLGVLALAGLNRDWLSEKFSAKTTATPTTITATSTTSTTAITAVADSEPMTTELPTSISHDIDTALTLPWLNESPLDMVIGYPDGKLIPPINHPVKVWESADSAVFAKADCKPIVVNKALVTQRGEFAKFNITLNPAWQYATCQVNLEAMSQNARRQWQKSPLPSEITEIVLPHGLSPLFPVQKTTETVSATATTVQPLQSYFLPK